MVTLHRASRVVLQLHGTPSHACAFSKKIYGRSKVENGRTKLIVLGQIVHTLFISNFILCQILCGMQAYSTKYRKQESPGKLSTSLDNGLIIQRALSCGMVSPLVQSASVKE